MANSTWGLLSPTGDCAVKLTDLVEAQAPLLQTHVAKGLFALDSALPQTRKVLLVGRQNQRKVDARDGCMAATHGISSFEILRTYERPEKVRLDVYLTPLLEVGVGERKAELLREIAAREGINLEQVIAVGDGANDLPMLGAAGLGIAFRAKPLVKENAAHSISTLGLDGILYLIGVRDKDQQELLK